MSKKPLGGLAGLIQIDDTTSTEADLSHTLAPRPAPSPAPVEEEPTRPVRSTNAASRGAHRRPPKTARPQLRKEGFLVHPTAKMQFDMLKARLKSQHRGSVGPGPALLHEALNLLFRKYGEPTVDLEESA